ncbi:hypothetical protein OH76DRAFT_103288 [Lentinus brumalis]|uniref:F-box domain-containing protein n=1 Tax=Lentinus brumalis TaxID=2498619 RepID=A0A371CQ21_9APHY|nr:hypothetical protein OH76DRAFT_103288 [Polyporus brumalis]
MSRPGRPPPALPLEQLNHVVDYLDGACHGRRRGRARARSRSWLPAIAMRRVMTRPVTGGPVRVALSPGVPLARLSVFLSLVVPRSSCAWRGSLSVARSQSRGYLGLRRFSHALLLLTRSATVAHSPRKGAYSCACSRVYSRCTSTPHLLKYTPFSIHACCSRLHVYARHEQAPAALVMQPKTRTSTTLPPSSSITPSVAPVRLTRHPSYAVRSCPVYYSSHPSHDR